MVGDMEATDGLIAAKIRKIFVCSTLVFILLPVFVDVSFYSISHGFSGERIVDECSLNIEIPCGSDYYIKFSSGNLTLNEGKFVPCTSTLSEKAKNAIVRAPVWIQRDLARQFHAIKCDVYADLILNADEKVVDEIAFSIASSPIGDVPPADVIKENAIALYENDKHIRYADVVDYNISEKTHYSTVRYQVVENGLTKTLEYPPYIYYWYVVHPRVTSENPAQVYRRFWRDYLFYHNDIGYPLLKEKLSQISLLWDCQSYYQPAYRTWKWSIANHPTAIEAISYWIGKTVPKQAYGDRPVQPNIIAHEHNGWCGELQKIAVAALRTSLIPSVGICDHGEDHVWREFFERGWHENDNWWADGGGAVDKPDVYAYKWRKNISALFAWRGDDSIYDVTPRYIHQADRVKVRFVVTDLNSNPVDGARITPLVVGVRDITWLKWMILEKIDAVWEKLPSWLKGRILQFIYESVKASIEKMPESMETLLPCIWNYTNLQGESVFHLGRNRSYIFLIQYGNLGQIWQPAHLNKIRILAKPRNTTFHVTLPVVSKKLRCRVGRIPQDKYMLHVSFDTRAYQINKNIFTGKNGRYEMDGRIEFFVVNKTNFERYRNGKRFRCVEYIEAEKSEFDFYVGEGEWYIVFRNNALRSNVLLSFLVELKVKDENIDREYVHIVAPQTTIFKEPTFDIGEAVGIEGVVSSDIVTVEIDNLSYRVLAENGRWSYVLDTSSFKPGRYKVSVICGDSCDETWIRLVDVSPPIVKIEKPFDMQIMKTDSIVRIAGRCSDNQGVAKVEIAINNGSWRRASGNRKWFFEWDTTGFEAGEYMISVRATDLSGSVVTDHITVILNSSTHMWKPKIIDFYHHPVNPTNKSNVVIYANVTEDGPFSIKKVILHWNSTLVNASSEMFRYATNPIQGRHDEDPLKNMSNYPLFGLELGEFPKGSRITYWVEAIDTANNSNISSKKTFIVAEIEPMKPVFPNSIVTPGVIRKVSPSSIKPVKAFTLQKMCVGGYLLS
jgi:hypothetical protein